MHYLERTGLLGLLILAPAAIFLIAQEPTAGGTGAARGSASGASAAAIAGSKEDPAAVERGGKLYVTNCGGCHGATARGGVGAPDLVRSILVLDDEKGILIAPVLRNGRPEQGMPAARTFPKRRLPTSWRGCTCRPTPRAIAPPTLSRMC